MASLPDGVKVQVRAARRADLAALTALRQSVGWSSGGLQGSFAAVEAGRQQIFLAVHGDHLLGAATLSLQTNGALRRGHISDLVVSPLWRRRGIGSMLLEAAEAASRQHDLVECTLDVDANNEPAIALYLGRGYRHYRPAYFPWGPGYTLRKPLADAPPPPRRRFWRFWRRSD